MINKDICNYSWPDDFSECTATCEVGDDGVTVSVTPGSQFVSGYHYDSHDENPERYPLNNQPSRVGRFDESAQVQFKVTPHETMRTVLVFRNDINLVPDYDNVTIASLKELTR